MKKIIAIIILLTGTFLFLISCSKPSHTKPSRYNIPHVDSVYCDFEVVEETDYYSIVYDRHTRVMYIHVSGYYSAVITPIYNADGTVKLYEE